MSQLTPFATASIDLVELVRSNERVIAKLDQILDGQKTTADRIDRLETRVAEVETQVRHYRSVIATLSAGIGLAGGILIPWLRQKVGL